ncbi:hypothetical protein EDC04DRAFT_2620040 [Pisolithus marmoratus]|nr:hypothetical protein EDC04DRAFT_2620040 [Pisolithus marmoratus]
MLVRAHRASGNGYSSVMHYNENNSPSTPKGTKHFAFSITYLCREKRVFSPTLHKHRLKMGRMPSVGTVVSSFPAKKLPIIASLSEPGFIVPDVPVLPGRIDRQDPDTARLGYEKYLKTTLYGGTWRAPSYAMVGRIQGAYLVIVLILNQ